MTQSYVVLVLVFGRIQSVKHVDGKLVFDSTVNILDSHKEASDLVKKCNELLGQESSFIAPAFRGLE